MKEIMCNSIEEYNNIIRSDASGIPDFDFAYDYTTSIGNTIKVLSTYYLNNGDTIILPASIFQSASVNVETKVDVDIDSIKQQILEELGYKQDINENEITVHECVVNNTLYRLTKEKLNGSRTSNIENKISSRNRKTRVSGRENEGSHETIEGQVQSA